MKSGVFEDRKIYIGYQVSALRSLILGNERVFPFIVIDSLQLITTLDKVVVVPV